MRKFLLAAVVAAAAVFGSTSSAEAAYLYGVRVYDSGVLQFEAVYDSTTNTSTINVGTGAFGVGGNSLIFTTNTTNFTISNGSGLSNNPGTQGGSNLNLSSNEHIDTTFGTAGGTHTIRIEISQTGWTAPTGTPLTLSSSAGGSTAYLQGTNLFATQTIGATYQGFLANDNVLFAQPAAGSTPIQTASTSQSSVGTLPLVFSPGTSTNVTVPGGTPFSMTDALEFSFTLSAGSGQAAANVSASTVASVPAPAGLVLALTALPALGIGGWLRRRRLAV